MHMTRSLAVSALLLSAASIGVGSAPASAATLPNLVTNPTFNQTTTGTLTQSEQFGTYSSSSTAYVPAQTLAGWTSPGGYNFVFLSKANATALASNGVSGAYSVSTNNSTYGAFSLAGPNSSPVSNNGFQYGAPDGSGGYTNNYLALDGAYPTSPGVAVTQTLSNLTVGKAYAVSFAWAAAQQAGSYTGPTTDNIKVTFGSTSKQTANVVNQTQGFSGWMGSYMTFVATSTSQTLSFLASGSPSQPPFLLLANVSVTASEPGSIAMLVTGLVGLTLLTGWRSRARSASPASAQAV